ncbi:uncharacterized protein LOC134231811 [Saccostrea cucullata]|uniref:uncharacterized protein LOC134231811 n=1 Tax=Saccostrea cuccullata TaxID=36930 RepID=UPI002ED51A4E
MSCDTHSETKRGRRCVAGGCSSTHLDGVSLHYFPFKKEPHLVPKWTAFVRLKRKWPEGPTKYSSLCELHFDDSCYPFEYRFKKSQGIPVKNKVLNPGSVPTKHHPSVLGKRDLSSIEEGEEKSNEREKKERKRIRGAFVKRENFRIITEKTEVQNKSMQEAEARKSEEDSNCTMTDNEINHHGYQYSQTDEIEKKENDIWFDLDVEEELDNKEDLSEDSSDHEETDSDTIGTENAGFGILPYQYEPYATSDEDASDNSEADEEDRTHNTDWCSCQCCTIMASNTENRCCQEIQQVKEEISRTDTSLNCITHHPGFRTVCLDIHVLRTAYYQYRQQYGGNLEESTKRHRYTAYRQFVRWCWGYLGKKVRVVIPSCAVSKIRETFPLQPGETHTGFNFAD